VDKYCTAGQSTYDNMAHVRTACWIPKATETHSEYVILTAFPLRQRLHERASMLPHTYTACLFFGFQTLKAVEWLTKLRRGIRAKFTSIRGQVLTKFSHTQDDHRRVKMTSHHYTTGPFTVLQTRKHEF
jgi:hypothetical protein